VYKYYKYALITVQPLVGILKINFYIIFFFLYFGIVTSEYNIDEEDQENPDFPIGKSAHEHNYQPNIHKLFLAPYSHYYRV